MKLSLFILLLPFSIQFAHSSPVNNVPNGVGLLEVFPFKDDKESLRCTAFHIGQGYVVSAAHCFLGAQSCNRARVWFGLNGNFKTVQPSHCQSVFKVSLTDQSTSESQVNDFIIFKIDNIPNFAFEIEEKSSIRTGVLKSYSYSNDYKLKETNCIGTAEIKDAFGRKRHTNEKFGIECLIGSYAHGSPLLNSTGKVIGIHQSSLFSPKVDATQQKDKSLAITLPFSEKNFLELPTSRFLPLGGFEPESFPYGLPDKLNLHVTTLPVTQYSTTFVKLRNSASSTFVIIDANKKRIEVSELPDETALKTYSIKTPAEIYLQTSKNVYAINDAVEIIP